MRHEYCILSGVFKKYSSATYVSLYQLNAFFFLGNMYIRLKCFILMVAVAAADKQIKLEDIERDNLISERRATQQEALSIEQTQHLRTPGSHGVPPYEVSTIHLFGK